MIAITAGHNSSRFGEEEDIPPKGQRVVDRNRAEQVLLSARLLSSLFKVPRSRIMEKRKGGEEGRALRRPLICYARSIGSPVWECAKLFDLNRKQIGQEEASFLEMISERPGLNRDWDNLVTFFDYAFKIDRGRFLLAIMEENDRQERGRKAAKLMEAVIAFLRAAPPPKPKKAKLNEAERIVADGKAKRRRQALKQEIAIAESVIAKGKGAKATKEQRKDADREREKLKRLLAELEATR